MLSGVITSISAQECTTTWPYLFNDFQPGTVYFKDGAKTPYRVNIHILKSKLHYLEDGSEEIKEAVSEDYILVKIGEDTFYSRQGKMVKVVASNEGGFIGECTVADMAALNTGETAAYGASANSMSTRKLSSIDGEGPSVSTNHMNLKNSKDDGIYIPTEKEYYIVTQGTVFPANKKQLEMFLPKDKADALKGFLKKNKISWKSPESLLKLVEFINN